MKPYVGGGWYIKHITDRTVLLEKDDFAYRQVTGRNGYVFVRGEPEQSRERNVFKACEMAKRNDEELAIIIGKKLAPSLKQLAEYTGKQVKMVNTFGTPEDPSQIGVKRI